MQTPQNQSCKVLQQNQYFFPNQMRAHKTQLEIASELSIWVKEVFQIFACQIFDDHHRSFLIIIGQLLPVALQCTSDPSPEIP